MKKILAILLVVGLTAAAAWLVRGLTPAQADDVPNKDQATASKGLEQKGLEYLAARQREDGHWEGDDGQHPVAMTGLVGIALLMEREMPTGRRMLIGREMKHAANIRKAADWLVATSQAGRDGLIFSNHASETTRYMQGHGLATIFLAGACDEEKDEKRRKMLGDVVQAAVNYIAKSQSSQGGWHDTSKLEGHDFASIGATVIQVQALQAAENAGVSIPEGVLSDGLQYLKAALDRAEADPKAAANTHVVDLAGALACTRTPNRAFAFEGGDVDPPAIVHGKVLTQCQKELPCGPDTKLGRDELAHFYLAQTLYDRRGKDLWSKHRDVLFERLRTGQNADGSWPAGTGLGVGSTYSTALWCIVLQLERRSHPSLRRLEMLIVTQLGADLGPFSGTLGGPLARQSE